MKSTTTLRFTKMHGAGNDYIYVDGFAERIPTDVPELARKMSHRRFGIGGDGLILMLPSEAADAQMRMFNADGSEGEMCGNAIRCVAKYLHDNGIVPKVSMNIETGAGVLSLDLETDEEQRVHRVTVDMDEPILDAPHIPTTLLPEGRVVDHAVTFEDQMLNVTCVSMGNPHCVIFVDAASDDLVLGLGPIIEKDHRFPNRVNVEFVEVVSRTEVRQRTWERGSGETWACGTGAAAVCVAGVLTGRTDRTILNHLVGGDLTLHWDESTNHVMKTGGAVEVYSGCWNTE